MLDAANQRFAAVCAMLYARVAGAAGPSLRSATASAGRGLLQACQAFLDSLKRPVGTSFVFIRMSLVHKKLLPPATRLLDTDSRVGTHQRCKELLVRKSGPNAEQGTTLWKRLKP